MLPIIRPRRNRKHKWLRDLVAETTINIQDLIYPLFITEGTNIKEPAANMPGVYIYSIDCLVEEVAKAIELGIKAINLFPRTPTELKSPDGALAYNPNNLTCRAIRKIKATFANDIGIICDVALDPYTTHGHDGILNHNNIDVDNDLTLEALSKQALVLAQSGVDMVSPSDMMDGRIRYIRNSLDQSGFNEISIMSYAAKYASKLYGPFRGAIGSKVHKICKAGYQMDVRNHKEAMQEINLDINESADIILIKPAIHCLDIIFNASKSFDVPIFAYQVSGEYAMLASYSKELDIDFMDLILEALICIKRSGAKAIFSYAATQIANFLKQ